MHGVSWQQQDYPASPMLMAMGTPLDAPFSNFSRSIPSPCPNRRNSVETLLIHSYILLIICSRKCLLCLMNSCPLKFPSQTVTSNPGLMSQMTNMMQNNPAMMEHAQRMMQNPAALERAAQVDLDGAFAAGAAGSMNPGLGAGFPTATGGATPTFPTPNPPAAPPAPVPTPSATSNSVVPPANSQNSTGEGTEEASGEMSEDDILAEAIRRSMEDS